MLYRLALITGRHHARMSEAEHDEHLSREELAIFVAQAINLAPLKIEQNRCKARVQGVDTGFFYFLCKRLCTYYGPEL
jgi:hypothetical protein